MRWLLYLTFAGCGGGSQVPVDSTEPAFCYGQSRVCFWREPVLGAFELPPLIDTSSECAPDLSEPSICALVADQFTIDGPIRVRGKRPLILLANSIAISATGSLDLVKTANDVCDVGSSGGGSFGGIGGASLTSAGSSVSPMNLRAGCAGEPGFFPPVLGGGGGGAVALVANSISVEGVINAGGGGGAGCSAATNKGCSGGGGGSGGMIIVDAPNVTGSGVLAANGGGGGSAERANTPGVTGESGEPNAEPATGGDNPDNMTGFRGGDGAAGAVLDGGAGATNGSCSSLGFDCLFGGGGGGAGIIRIPAGAFAGTVSPPAT